MILFNKSKNRSVYLGSIVGRSPDFYSSYFEDKVIPPLGNTSFNIVFLPRQLGESFSTLLIHTSFGVINYPVQGVGVECPYRLRPLVGLKAPLNSTISPEINLYNPHDTALQVSIVERTQWKFFPRHICYHVFCFLNNKKIVLGLVSVWFLLVGDWESRFYIVFDKVSLFCIILNLKIRTFLLSQKFPVLLVLGNSSNLIGKKQVL